MYRLIEIASLRFLGIMIVTLARRAACWCLFMPDDHDIRPLRARGATARETGSALGKAMAVLETVIDDDYPVTLPDLARRLDMPRQTAHRVVRQLVELGLLQRDVAQDEYSIGARMSRLARRALQRSSRRGGLHAVLVALTERLGETCNLGILDGHEVLYLDRVECDWPLRVRLEAGSHVPVHCTAIGKLLLAHMADAARERLLKALPLTRHTANTLTEPRALARSFAEIREMGYSVNNEEFALGLIALAVPVRDRQGEVVAGLAVHAPAARMSLDSAIAHLPLLEDAAARISDVL
jgi:DNA-binding IclR family transcriptional regulator